MSLLNPRALSGTSPRSRIVGLAGAVFALLFIIHFLFPSSNPILLHTQKWTTASSSMIRSKFLRAKAQEPKPPIHHPIPKLMSDARDKFDNLLKRQSKTLPAAVAEYERRYGRKPPKGFDEWYEFAKENGAIVFDEYDQLSKDLEPFWQLSGEEIRRRCIQVGFLPSVDLVRIQDGKTRTIDVSKGFDDSEVGARAKGFRVMLEKFQAKLPNMDFPINEKAEGRILVPWEEKLYSNLTADSKSESSGLRELKLTFQRASNTFWAESSFPTGKATQTSGSRIDGLVTHRLKLDDSSDRSGPNSRKAKCQSPVWPTPVSLLKRRVTTLFSPKASMTSTISATTRGRTTTKDISSPIGEQSTHYTRCSRRRRVWAIRTFSFRAIITSLRQSDTRTDGTRST